MVGSPTQPFSNYAAAAAAAEHPPAAGAIPPLQHRDSPQHELAPAPGSGGLSRTVSGNHHISPSLSRAASVAAAWLRDPHHDSKKPIFHVMPRSGWSSDPHGALFWKGRYHLFYQHRLQTCQWHWGLCWNHVVSTDLVHWERLPPALVPTPGGHDADGCFSGSCTVDPATGYPIIFYTGARLRENPEVQLGPVPDEYDLRLEHVESQCCAVPEDPENDELLIRWKKIPTPWMQFPHTNQLTAWRDPIIIDEADVAQKGPGGVKEHMMVVCSGYKGIGASTLIYRSTDLMHGWQFAGDLARWKDLQMGKCWECPILAKLRPLPLNHHTLTTLNTPSLAPPESGISRNASLQNRSREPSLQHGGLSGEVQPVQQQPAKAESLTTRVGQVFGAALDAVTGNSSNAGDGPNHSSSAADDALQPLGSAAQSIGGNWVNYPEQSLESDARVGALGTNNQVEVMVTATTTATIKSDGLGQPKEVIYAQATEPEVAAAQVVAAAGGEGINARRRASMSMTPEAIAAAQAAAAEAIANGGPGYGQAEGPVLAPADKYPGCFPPDERYRWFFSISPDACTYSIIYFMGTYTRNKFHLDDGPNGPAQGPYKLDLGNVLYAPTCFNDPKGRHILWGYMRELRSVPPPPCMCDTFSYAGCVSLPRVLWIKGDRLFQAPLPEMVSLRTDVSWHGANLPLQPEQPLPLPGVAGVHLDIELLLTPGSADRTCIVLKSFRPGGKGAMAVVFHWSTHLLEIVYDVFEKPRKWRRVYGNYTKDALPADSSLPRTATGRSRRSSTIMPPVAEGHNEEGGGVVPSDLAARMATAGMMPPVPEGLAAPPKATAASLAKRALAGSDPDFGAAPDTGRTASGRPKPGQLFGANGSNTIGAVNHQAVGSNRAYYQDPEDDADLEIIDMYDINPDVNPELRMKRKEAGGVLDMDDGEPLELRIFLDGSSLEIFTGSGEVLSTRCYRGHPPAGCVDCGIELVSIGGVSEVERVAAYEVGCCWLRDEELPLGANGDEGAATTAAEEE